MPQRLTITQTRQIRRVLEDAQESLTFYLDPDDENCSVPRDARLASENYLSTWVLAQLEGVLTTLDATLGDAS